MIAVPVEHEPMFEWTDVEAVGRLARDLPLYSPMVEILTNNTIAYTHIYAFRYLRLTGLSERTSVSLRERRASRRRSSTNSVDPFTRKDWYDIKAPSFFDTRNVGKTLVNRTQGLKNANDYLKNRVLEVNLADLNNNQEDGFRKVKLQIQEIQGKNCLTNFYGMDFTSDKLRSLVKKWQSLIEAHMDVKTSDGYLVRLFTIAFTKRRPNQVRKTTYATHAQIRQIRKKMFEIMQREASSCDLKELVQKLMPEVIGKAIEKATQGIYPLQNVFVRKVKILKAPKFDLGKLLELHGESGNDMGKSVPGAKDFKEPAILDSV